MKRFLLYILAPLFLTGCASTHPPYATVDGFAQGSTFHIVYHDPEGRDLRPEIEQLLDAFDHSLSVYNPASLLSRINRGDPDAMPDPWFAECLEISRRISEETNGAFDVTVRPLVTAYRLGADEGPHILTPEETDSILTFVGYDRVRIENGRLVKEDPRIQIDFNAIAQGYSADLVGEIFDSLGIHDYLVEIGGEIVCRGRNPQGRLWCVGLDRPFEGNMVPGQDLQTIIELTDCGLVTSGNYRKFAYDGQGNKVVHTLDPVSGRPATHNLLSATIVAPTSALADGYATACMVMGLERSRKLLGRHPELEGYLIYAGEGDVMDVWMTPGMSKYIAK